MLRISATAALRPCGCFTAPCPVTRSRGLPPAASVSPDACPKGVHALGLAATGWRSVNLQIIAVGVLLAICCRAGSMLGCVVFLLRILPALL